MQRLLGKHLASLCLTLGLLAACRAGTTQTGSPASKIHPRVAAAAQALMQGGTTSAHTDAQGRLQVYVYVTDFTAYTLDRLTQAGLDQAQGSPEMGLVQGWIAPRDLDGLASLPPVTAITLPLYASPR